jgi:hypothetical protein
MLAAQNTATRTPFPTIEDQRLDALVADMIDLNAEGDATRKRLLERGWSTNFLDEHESAARAQANKCFVRDVNDDPVRSLRQVEDDMADIIKTMLPPKQVLVAELQARSFTKTQIDLLMRKAMARAALAFAHGNTGLVS